MKRITYQINGYVEFSTLCGAFRVEFTGGQMSTINGTRPATFSTSDPMVQEAIRNSPKYAKGIITIKNEVEIEDKYLVVKEDGQVTEHLPSSEGQCAPGESGVIVYDEVTNVQAARNILMEKYGVPMEQLQNKEQIKAKAKELCINFTNWK